MKKQNTILTALIITLFLFVVSPVPAQLVLFDFNNAPLHSSLPLDQTAGGVTAHLSATGTGYSIQDVNALGFTPQGFTGYMLYPNSIYAADLLVHFDQTITDFSIMYACQELACDDAATMRVTAYMNSTYVGYADRTATFPGTWPVDTLKCSFPQGFNSVVVHYQAHPPTCQDYGTIFIADNMRVTPLVTGIIPEKELAKMFTLSQNYPNPFNPSTTIIYQIPTKSYVSLKVFDLLGKEVATLVNGVEQPGEKSVNFNAGNLESGVYFYRLQSGKYSATRKLVLVK